MAGTYGLDQSWPEERDRLRIQASLFDPTTLDWCNRSGLCTGARVLELGAGEGSVARAMAERVGPDGHVVAVDLDARFLAEGPDKPDNLDVLELNILKDPLPPGPFDLVHARLVLSHLGEPVPLLKAWTRLLSPGGWMVIEDADWTGAERTVPPSEAWTRLIVAMREELGKRGFDWSLGFRLPGLLCEAGLTSVEARTLTYRGPGNPKEGVPGYELLAKQLSPALLESRKIDRNQYDEAIRVLRDPNIWFGATITTARGRRALVGQP